jgi:hypothetical protein
VEGRVRPGHESQGPDHRREHDQQRQEHAAEGAQGEEEQTSGRQDDEREHELQIGARLASHFALDDRAARDDDPLGGDGRRGDDLLEPSVDLDLVGPLLELRDDDGDFPVLAHHRAHHHRVVEDGPPDLESLLPRRRDLFEEGLDDQQILLTGDVVHCREADEVISLDRRKVGHGVGDHPNQPQRLRSEDAVGSFVDDHDDGGIGDAEVVLDPVVVADIGVVLGQGGAHVELDLQSRNAGSEERRHQQEADDRGPRVANDGTVQGVHSAAPRPVTHSGRPGEPKSPLTVSSATASALLTRADSRSGSGIPSFCPRARWVNRADIPLMTKSNKTRTSTCWTPRGRAADRNRFNAATPGSRKFS